MKNRILVLSFFYTPDLSAGSFRAAALVRALQEQDANLKIDVLTTQPNRYAEHDLLGMSFEQLDGVSIQRIRLPKLRKGFVGQAVSFWRYARKCITITSGQDYDVVVATSSRLMTAVLGAWIAWRKDSFLYLDLRDIFTENLKLLFPTFLATPLAGVFGLLERWAIGRAGKINLVSKGFLDYFKPRYPNHEFSVFPNGIDELFLDFNTQENSTTQEANTLRILYAGNIGDGQALHSIIPKLANILTERVQFKIIGSGSCSGALREKLEANLVNNVEIINPLPRQKLLSLYKNTDILFLHLADYPAFHRVLPSKLFEYAATGKPILAGVDGYCRDFILRELPNVSIFKPGDAVSAVVALKNLTLGTVDRGEFLKKYSRSTIMSNMAMDIISVK